LLSEQTSKHSSNTSRAALSVDDLRGVFLPITTPFSESGAVDFAGLRANISKWNTTGIRGYVMLGSTGERVHLEEREYLDVVAVAREVASKSLRFIVGAGQQSTLGTINEIKRVLAEDDVDAFLVITPSFYRPIITQAALIRYYEEVAGESPVPIVLYSMPALTGIKIEPETAAALSRHANIIGIKDSSNDLDGLRKTIDQVPADFAVMTGNGTVLCDALRGGAVGGILAVGCVVPDICVAIFDLVKANQIETAVDLQKKLTPLAQAVTTRFGLGGLKAALEMQGYAGGHVRKPLIGPSAEAISEIRQCLEAVRLEAVKA
jgi:4-hydroxy-2-oxoglutarate aldolase